MTNTICRGCGQLQGVKDYDDTLWDIYYRLRDGRHTWEPLVYTREEFEESWDDDGETNWAMIAMERNMADRGLCPECGRPNLTGVRDDEIMDEEESRELHEMWAEMAAERRMGA